MIYLQPDPQILKDTTKLVGNAWGGNRELDCRVAYALGMDWVDDRLSLKSWRNHVDLNGFDLAWMSDHVFHRTQGVPYFTTNMDECFTLKWRLLPHHDYFSIDGDPSGFGAEIGNWLLTTNTLHDYAKASGATPELAFLVAILKAYYGKITETGESKSMG
jgi:hypothetical protein